MPLSAGDRLGPYEILSCIGAGGMGEVYRANDARLVRDVAIKVLPAALANDPERLRRFEREARLLASLEHPNIGGIYGLEESNGTRALVLALIDGPTLADRIAQNPLSVAEATDVALQIAAAFEYAHDRGVIHRDLKPANVKIALDGTVKVLDFGLAKAIEDEPQAAATGANSPTLTLGPTQPGIILGTAAYISPEQVKGKRADRRSDIWSFGVVLYEMLTGQRPFSGGSIGEVLADVVKEEAKLDAVPPTLRPLVARCLIKDPRRRLQSFGEARLMLQEPQWFSPGGSTQSAPTSRFGGPVWIAGWIMWAGLALATAILGIGFYRAAHPASKPLIRLSVDLGEDFSFGGPSFVATLSPNGNRILQTGRVVSGNARLVTRLLSQQDTVPIPGTEGARNPFFSPDGEWVGFFRDGKLQKVPVQGGAATVLCGCEGPGASWSEYGTIVAASGPQSGLVRIPDTGGTPQPLTQLLSGELTHRWPQVIPGRKVAIFTANNRAIQYEKATIQAVSWQTGERKILVRDAYYGRYVPSGMATGHLIYMQAGTLFGVGFDPDRLLLLGTPVALLQDIGGVAANGSAWFEFSTTGTFLYRIGSAIGGARTVAWLDPSGKRQPLLAKPSHYDSPRFSPDGQSLALLDVHAKGRDIYVYDLRRDVATRLTDTGENELPIWAPDGKHVVYDSRPETGSAIWWKRADGAGEPVRLLESKTLLTPYSISADGRLAYYDTDARTRGDIWTLPLDLTDPEHPKPGKPELFLGTTAFESQPAFSPDGHWIAYRSDESGINEVYVRRFAESGSSTGKWQISAGGGRLPMWSNSGTELFFITLEQPSRIMVTDYSVSGESFHPKKPRTWFEGRLFTPSAAPFLDLHPDGKRFAVFPPPASEEGGPSVHMIFLLNFFDELRRRVPTGGK
jgi:serine/threonine-protein kinase